ncbi:MAG: hypothetical protein WBD36_06800, partial [Bacteroidota bacterium]
MVNIRFLQRVLFAFFLNVSLLVAQDHLGINRIWAVDDCEKIRQDDLNHPLAQSSNNPVWNDKRVAIFGARNEIVAFQVVIESGKQGAKHVSVSLKSLVGPAYVIENVTNKRPLTSSVGKRIEIFREHYIRVTKRTRNPSMWWDGARPSDYYLGPIPDGLIPVEVGTDKGGAPFNIEAKQNQGVWVDIYIPRQTPPGQYKGDLEIRVQTDLVRTIPVELEVHNFDLPDSTHFHNFFFTFSEGISTKHGVRSFSPAYYSIEQEYYKMAHRHRMDLSFNQTVDSLDRRASGYYTGEFYTEAYGYDGPGVGVGNGTYSIGTYDQPSGRSSGFFPPTKTVWQTASDKWADWFEKNVPTTWVLRYMHDEPDSTKYSSIREKAGWIHTNP